MFCNIHNGYQRTPLHIINAAEVYEKCKSRNLITSFNKSGLCVGYDTMKWHRGDLAKYAVTSGQGKEKIMALPSQFSPSSFTVTVFDNFDHPDWLIIKNALSGNASAHDTAVTVFQEKPGKPLRKQLKNEMPLSSVMTLAKLSLQQLKKYADAKDLKLQGSFIVVKEVYWSENKIQDQEQNEFIMSCVRSQNLGSNILPTWDENEIFAIKGVIVTVLSRIFAIFPTPCDRVFNSLYCNAKFCLFCRSFRSDIVSCLLWRRCISNHLRYFSKMSSWIQELTSDARRDLHG